MTKSKRSEKISDERIKSINKTDAILVSYFASGKICSDIKNLKLQLIDNHFQKCCKIQTCGWCKNYFSLLTYHARSRCTSEFKCSVPYCLPIKQKLISLNIQVRMRNFLKYKVINFSHLVLAPNFKPDTNIK